MKNPCTRTCPRRTVGCQIGCRDWALWEEAKAARREAKLRKNAVISYVKDQQLKARSRRHTRSRNQS